MFKSFKRIWADVETPTLKAYPTPLWFMFNSKLDVIADDGIPPADYFCGVHRRISDRLGEQAVGL